MQSTHALQAVKSIYQVSDLTELLEINKLIVQQMRALSKRATRTLVKGQTVSFHSNKYGRPVQGKIVKVGYKNLRVLESSTNTTWRVPAAMCKVI